MISTIISVLTLSFSNYIISHSDLSQSMYFIKFLLSGFRNNCTLSCLFILCCHAFGISVLASFPSLIFCISPSLYLCSLFWSIYEIFKNNINVRQDLLGVRQYFSNRDCLATV